ncbi:hypothetical protein SGLAM104S_10521 [Streptomyces glaucescens]
MRFMTSSDNPAHDAETPEAAARTGVAAQDWATASADPQYRAAVVDLLGALAYGELAAFERLAEDAKLAPTLEDKAELAKMASAEFHHFERLSGRLTEIGEEPTAAMEPFVAALDGFHKQTAPSDWLEGLVKAYVGDSIASDFYREVAARLDSDTRELVLAVLDDTGHAGFAVEKVRAAIDADPRVGRAARAVGAAADGRGPVPVAAGGRGARRAVDDAGGRRRRRLRPGRGRPDVLPDHRGAHQADGGAGTGRLRVCPALPVARLTGGPHGVFRCARSQGVAGQAGIADAPRACPTKDLGWVRGARG